MNLHLGLFLLFSMILMQIVTLNYMPGNTASGNLWTLGCKSEACKNVTSSDFSSLYTLITFNLFFMLIIFIAHVSNGIGHPIPYLTFFDLHSN